MSEMAGTPSADMLMRAARQRLQAEEIESAALDARLIAAHAFGVAPDSLLGEGAHRMATPGVVACFEALIGRRLQGEPISHILGAREFWSLSFKVNHATLAPRPESETLVEAALKRMASREAKLEILDLGTGSGCLLISLLHEWPYARGVAVDKSLNALEVARENAYFNKCAERISFIHGSWGEGIDAQFDIIVSNPPYLSHEELGQAPRELQFEPRSALDGGSDGLDAYRHLIPELPRLLRHGGCAFLEIGATQSEAVSAMVRAAGLCVEAVERDLAGRNRCIVAGLPRLGAG